MSVLVIALLAVMLAWAPASSEFAAAEGGDGPRARNYHGTVYEAVLNRIILFGGIIGDPTSPDLYRPVADTWALNVASNQWTRLAPSSHSFMSSTDVGRNDAMVGFGTTAYDVESDAVVFFRSLVDDYDDPTPGQNEPANETWVLQGPKVQWVLKESDARAPSAGRFGPDMAYDSQSDRIVLFGGWNASTDRTYPRDTWAYDYNTNTWEQMSPIVSPPGRNYHRMVYDPNTDRIILFGGFPVSGALNDMWAYDYDTDTWTRLNPASAPSPRGYSAMAYDERSRVIVLFGGVDAPAEMPNAEIWVFDPATNAWTQKSPANAPSARGWHDMVYSPSAGRVVLFGGGPDRFHPMDDLWFYDTASNTWTLPGATPPADSLFVVVLGLSGAAIGGAAIVVVLLLRRRKRNS